MQVKSLHLNRYSAAGIHLVISALVGLGVLALMHFVWYPGGFFKLLGGSELLMIILGVDVCLGPLLTLAVYAPNKKSLKFDLTVIGLLQIAALLYGANVMFQSRPAFNVLEENIFKVTLASDLSDPTLLNSARRPEFQSIPLLGPKLIAAKLPTDESLRARVQEAAMAGLDWNTLPFTWVDYDSQRETALQHAKALDALRAQSDQNAVIVEAFLTQQRRPVSDFVYLPIVAGYVAMTAVLDAKTADFIDIIAIDP